MEIVQPCNRLGDVLTHLAPFSMVRFSNASPNVYAIPICPPPSELLSIECVYFGVLVGNGIWTQATP